ncbi:BTB/POZ domain-containing protein At5g03250, partial [Linum perenne]
FSSIQFPLISRSGLLSDLIEQLPPEEGSVCSLKLHDLPGGSKAFELAAKFCYGVKFELRASNVVSLRCAAEHLRMTEDYGEKNLILQTENFLKEVFTNWSDSVTALKSCQEILTPTEDLRIVSRCIHSLATKACSESNSNNSSPLGVSEDNVFAKSEKLSIGEDWWFEDVTFLNLQLYKRLILALEAKGMKPETISASVMCYAKRYLPLMVKQQKRQGTTPTTTENLILSEAEQRIYLEEIVTLLPTQKGVTAAHFLVSLLRTGIFLQASSHCKENLERRVGAQLDQATLQDLLIPNMGYSVETIYDVDCIQRIVDYFLSNLNSTSSPPYTIVEGPFMGESESLITSMTVVASLVDGFLSEVAPDVNLKLSKFETLAATIPDYARPVDDGLYHAIDVYLKAHPWLTESEKEQLCRLMNCQKLSLEASTHAAQNERLPLRLIIQVLFFEQIRLRTTVSGWFFVTDNMENSQQIDQLQLLKNESSCQVEQEIQAAGNDDGHKMKERVSELQKECLEIKEDIEKLVKAKKGWRLFSKSSRLKQKLQSCNSGKSCDFKDPEPLPIVTSVTNNEQKQNPDASEVSPQNFRFH